MKMFKTMAAFFLSFFFVTQSGAQFQVFAGPQMTTAKYLIKNVNQETEFKTGFMAGVGLTTLLEGPIYFSPSVYFSRKGYKVTLTGRATPPDSLALNNDLSLNSISLAPLLQVNFSKAKNYFFLRFGPAFDIGLSGREKFEKPGNQVVDRAILLAPVSYSVATAFANVHLGYESAKGLGFFVHYEHGLSSFNNSDYGANILHRVVGASAQWRF